MVGEQPSAAQPIQPAGKGRGSRGRRWLVVAAGVVCVLLVLRVGSSLLSGTLLNSRLAGIAGRSDQPASMELGRRLYADDCATCHGATGDAVTTAPLNSREFITNLGPRLEQAIANGKGTMAAWGRDRGGPMTSNEVKSVAEYVRTGNNFSGGGAAAPAVPTPGAGATPTAAPTVMPTATESRTPPAIPHMLPDQASKCLDCHGKSGQRPMPVNHAGRTNGSCTLCHAQSPAAPASTATPGTTPVATTPQR